MALGPSTYSTVTAGSAISMDLTMDLVIVLVFTVNGPHTGQLHRPRRTEVEWCSFPCTRQTLGFDKGDALHEQTKSSTHALVSFSSLSHCSPDAFWRFIFMHVCTAGRMKILCIHHRKLQSRRRSGDARTLRRPLHLSAVTPLMPFIALQIA